MIVRLLLGLVLLAALVAGYFAVVLNWSYSSGERAGYVQKLSKKGWVCKTWEGEMALASLPGTITEKFYFTVPDDALAARITQAMNDPNTRFMSLHYEEKVGLPTTCFGETRHFITGLAASPAAAPMAPASPQPVPAAPASAASPAR